MLVKGATDDLAPNGAWSSADSDDEVMVWFMGPACERVIHSEENHNTPSWYNGGQPQSMFTVVRKINTSTSQPN